MSACRYKTWANRIIAFIFLSLLLVCSYQSWVKLIAMGKDAVMPRTEAAARKAMSSTFPPIVKREDKKRSTAKNWPHIPLLEQGKNHLHDILTQAKDHNHFIKYTFFEINTLAHQVLQVPGIHKSFFVFKDEKGDLFGLNTEVFNQTYGKSADRFANHVLEVANLTQNPQNILICHALIKPLNTQFIPESWLKVADMPSRNQDRAHSLLQNKIPQLDVEQLMLADGLDPEEYVFRTDHHWTEEAGFYAFTKIAQHFRENFHLHTPHHMINMDHYHKEVNPSLILGSYGRFVGQQWAALDEISMIYPRFETKLEANFVYEGFANQGDFKQVLLNTSIWEEAGLYNISRYATYMGGNHALVIIRNHLAPNDKTLLIVCDSFACVVTPFLCLLFKEVHVFDPRLNPESATEYVARHRFDFILYLFTPRFSSVLK